VSAQRTAVIGAGIVGLAVARRLLQVFPGAEITVIDKEPGVAMHQTSHNSGVVHAGVYYSPGSLKAVLCTRGRDMLKEFCAEWELPYLECGKLIVARDTDEVAQLRVLEQRAEANQVPGIRFITADGIAEIEPEAQGAAALHSPRTAIVDFPAIASAMAVDLRQRGGNLLLAAEATALRREGSTVRVVTTAGEVVADRVVVCAGLYSDRVAMLAGDVADPAIVPFRGEYYRLADRVSHMVKGLIYPVPDPRYPFLGVHFTRMVSGGVEIGPNAVLALAREGYRRRDVDLGEALDTLRWPGFRAMAKAHWRMGAREIRSSLSRKEFARIARQYVPSLDHNDMLPAPAGVRAQAVGADGKLVDDFAVHYLGRVVALRNAPSPAATSSLAIAEHLVDKMAEAEEVV
jgi:L-2-hydroxyglutarate oxidase LhgO